MKTPRITIVGATGNVGRKVAAEVLTQKLTTPSQLTLLASGHSKGKTLEINQHQFTIEETLESSFANTDFCIFNTESDISAYFVPHALKAGAYVIDSSSHYRLNPEVPLIIPPVNRHSMSLDQKLYAHANCLASPISTVLNPLKQAFGIEAVQVSTYQSTSGAGKQAMDECWAETAHIANHQSYQRSYFERQIAFNLFPQVGRIRDDGYTYEEYKIMYEVRKVIGDIKISATAVRVPVMIGHSISLSVQLNKPFDLAAITNTLVDAPSVKLSDNHYSTPIEIVGQDDVFVGRIRQDLFNPQILHLWLCSDNLRRGAATDAIEMLQQLLLLQQSQQAKYG